MPSPQITTCCVRECRNKFFHIRASDRCCTSLCKILAPRSDANAFTASIPHLNKLQPAARPYFLPVRRHHVQVQESPVPPRDRLNSAKYLLHSLTTPKAPGTASSVAIERVMPKCLQALEHEKHWEPVTTDARQLARVSQAHVCLLRLQIWHDPTRSCTSSAFMSIWRRRSPFMSAGFGGVQAVLARKRWNLALFGLVFTGLSSATSQDRFGGVFAGSNVS